jgi:hypothetical protein
MSPTTTGNAPRPVELVEVRKQDGGGGHIRAIDSLAGTLF